MYFQACSLCQKWDKRYAYRNGNIIEKNIISNYENEIKIIIEFHLCEF